MRTQAISSKIGSKNNKIERSDTVETSDIKNLLLNESDPYQSDPKVITSVKVESDRTNMIPYSRSLNEDNLDVIKDIVKTKKRSSFELTSENQDIYSNENVSR